MLDAGSSHYADVAVMLDKKLLIFFFEKCSISARMQPSTKLWFVLRQTAQTCIDHIIWMESHNFNKISQQINLKITVMHAIIASETYRHRHYWKFQDLFYHLLCPFYYFLEMIREKKRYGFVIWFTLIISMLTEH